MPDWSYRTLLRPALFTLSPERARDLTLGAMATLAALPGGGLLIEAFGDLAPPPALSTVLAGVPVRSPIGIGVGIDATGRAARAWESLGVGFVEIGPITEQPVPSPATPVGIALTLWTVGLGLCRGYCWDVKGTSARGQRLCH